jgi:N-acetyl-alpha-D-muramate 1-phosphate uridylyltransferase
MIAAMILAAGRGERMRPLSDTTPKPLLEVRGKPLIVWQLRALARAGIRDIAINVSHLADRIIDEVGDGAAHGVSIRWSREAEPLETAGGIANAMPLLPDGPAIIVSGDIWTSYDYARLLPLASTMRRDRESARVHLVMVPNPAYHSEGDFTLVPQAAGASRIGTDPGPKSTYGNIGVYDTALFRELPRGVKIKLLPLLLDWIRAGRVSGELYEGPWANVGTPEELARLNATLAGTARGDSR